MNTRLIGVAAAALFGVGVAEAASFASASAVITNFQVTLIDLNPDDGIAPALVFLPRHQANYGTASGVWESPQGSQSIFDDFTSTGNPWQPGIAQATTTYASATSQITGNSTITGSTLSASGFATSPGDFTYDPAAFPPSAPVALFLAAGYMPSDVFFVYFRLSPYTLITIDADFSLQALAEGGRASVMPDGFVTAFGNEARASARLSVEGPAAAGGGGSQGATETRLIGATSQYDPGNGTWSVASQSLSATASLSFLNMTAEPMLGRLVSTAFVEGRANGNLSPIPEPSTWALLLAGVAVVSRVVARRR